ncbi:Ni/Fe hydrogenase subunit alpha [Candidatus Woesearchaeota archaeon CG10_big_fil_rev_8_21_14_0_10_44_13]|nr:MAG: Ni/Fe hydrogenase subunit alpha [Candidatus Woesearchaeota archaeon CG10_big_fil_rev_8_21_14_0_10_44_13]
MAKKKKVSLLKKAGRKAGKKSKKKIKKTRMKPMPKKTGKSKTRGSTSKKSASAKKISAGTRKIRLDHITKIEGHAKLSVNIEDGKVKKAKLDVYESARFFESLVLCRRYDETSPLTSRICGVCSPSHALTSILATENAFGVKVSRQTEILRELLLYGTIFQNHAVHLFVLALPDYLGYESVIEMASKYKDEVLMGLKIKQLGNELVTVVGGREIHPITAVVGGFSIIPEQRRLDGLLEKFRSMRPYAVKAVELFSKLKYPYFRRKSQAFALVNDTHSFYNGEINCVGGVCIPEEEYQNVFEEHIKKGSSAKVVLYRGKPFFNGALARLLVNPEGLMPEAKKYLKLVDFNNPFHNNLAQAIEILHCFDRIIGILESLRVVHEDPVPFTPKAGRGIAYTEAPRGLLVHDYTYDDRGHVMKSNIITPTAQNLKQMEDDLKKFLPPLLDKPQAFIKLQIEMLIRAYDPCFSCSAHFLELKISKK